MGSFLLGMPCHNMHLANCITLELEHTWNPHRAAEHALGKAVKTEQSLYYNRIISNGFSQKPQAGYQTWAVRLTGMQAWECDRAPRIDQNINMQLFGILFSHSWVFASVCHLQHSMPVLITAFSQRYLPTSEISEFSFTILLLQIIPLLIVLTANSVTQQAR